jgi:hypothetical protein
MSAVRLWPVMQGLMYEQSALDSLSLDAGAKDAGYFALTGFVPELFGLHFNDANMYASALNIVGRHTQFHNLIYYGIVPILLVWLSFLRGLGPRSLGMAAAYLAVVLTPMYLLQPLSDLVNIAIYPIHHDIICRTGGLFLLCAALVPILRSLQETGIEPEDWRLRWFLGFVGLILLCCLALIVRASQAKPHLPAGYVRFALVATKVLILAGLPACFIAVGRMKLDAATMARLTRTAAVLFGLTALVVAAVALRRGDFWHTWITFRGFAYTVASGLWAMFSIWYVRRELLERPQVRWRHWLFIGSGTATLLLCLAPISEYSGPRGADVLLISGALSMAKFVLLACVALEIVVLCGIAPGGRRQLLPLLGLLTLGDLMGHTKLYEHVGTHPFIDVAELYPRRHDWGQRRAEEGDPEIDVQHYRVNKPTQVLRWKDSELLSNINMVYEAPTYAGVDSDVKKNLLSLIKAFDGHSPDWNLRMGIYGTLTNPRLLDILGVKYDWDGRDLVIRPNALARMSLFENFEVLPDEKDMLARLNQPDFDPAQTIVLSAPPGRNPGDVTRFKVVDFESQGTSRITAQLNLKNSGVLLFNDSYSKYWECTCNGRPMPVLHANGNFMAVALPPGPCQLAWEFRPVPVLRLFWLSAGTSLFLAGVAVWAMFSRKPVAVSVTAIPALSMAA